MYAYFGSSRIFVCMSVICICMNVKVGMFERLMDGYASIT